MKKIAIIGGGIGGISFFVQMSDMQYRHHYVIFEPYDIGTNSSLNSHSPTMLCNTSVAVNLLYANNPDDFRDYLNSYGFAFTHSSFVPRYLLTQYAREKFTRAADLIVKNGGTVQHINQAVESFKPDDSGKITVTVENGSTEAFDYACLATGPYYNQKTTSISNSLWQSGKVVVGHSRYLESFLKDKIKICILGSKLSAIDAAIISCQQGIKVTLYSHSGLLPAVREALTPNRRSREKLANHCETATPRRFMSTINTIIERRRDAELPKVQGGFGCLIRDIEDIFNGNNYWEEHIAEIIDYANNQLPKMNPAERKKIKKRTAVLVSRFISSMPLENALKLLEFNHLGLLKVCKANSDDFYFDEMYIGVKGYQEKYDGLIVASGISQGAVSKSGTQFFLNQDTPMEEAEIRQLAEQGIWMLGSLCHPVYPIVNYLKFCVQRAHEFVKLIEEKEYENCCD